MGNHDSYSDSPEPVGWLQHHQLYSGVGADIVMESFHQQPGCECRRLFQQCARWNRMGTLAEMGVLCSGIIRWMLPVFGSNTVRWCEVSRQDQTVCLPL